MYVAAAIVVAGVGGALIASNAAGDAADAQAQAAAAQGDAATSAAYLSSQAQIEAANIQAAAARDAANAQASAARDAARMQSETARNVADMQQQQYQQTRTDLSPWRTAGVTANNKLAQLVAAGPGKFETSPGYQFRLSEGNKAIERSAAAKGMVLSGRNIKAIDRFSQNYATQDYDNFLRRYYASLTPWQNMSALGLSAAGTTSSAGASAINAAGNALMSGANAGANSLISGANAGAQGTNAAAAAIAAGIAGAANSQGQGMLGAADAYSAAQDARASGYINQANALGQGLNSIASGLGYFYGNNQTTPVSSGGGSLGGAWSQY